MVQRGTDITKKIKCPNWDGVEDICHLESTPTVCDVAVVDGKLHINADSYEYISEGSEGSELLCRNCAFVFPIPEGREVEWVNGFDSDGDG